jgi:hypothetical protein
MVCGQPLTRKEASVPVRALFIAIATAFVLALGTGFAQAQTEDEIIRLHDKCRAGDRDACGGFDAAIHAREHEDEWRHSHPEWYR